MRTKSLAPIVLAACLLLAVSASPAAAAGPAQILSEEREGPRVRVLTIATPAFTGPTKVMVILPAGYGKKPRRRWPVTYFLAGTMNTYRTFNSLIDGLELTKRFPSIVVSPNGDSGYWSDWYNGGAFGPPMYETYVARQLIGLIDERFRTRARRSQRAVAGTSMGGYGSMMIAARHPHLFSAAATTSGAVDSNLPIHGAVLSGSPAFQGAEPDAIYGPRAAQEVRWRGHNPTDLAENLRGLDLQIRAANGAPNPAIGENPVSADGVSCVVEAGTYMASTSMHEKLTSLGIPHEWKDYGPGCHTAPNFERELADTFDRFSTVFAGRHARPRRFDHISIEPVFRAYGWRVEADPGRPLEFMRLGRVGRRGLTITGSGLTDVRSAPLFRGVKRVGLTGATRRSARPDRRGRIRFSVDLGPVSSAQQYTPGSTTNSIAREVTFAARN